MIQFIHLLLLSLAGAGLFLLWRATQGDDPRVRAVVTLGFLLRAFAGQILFWVSYLKLPFGAHLQLRNGLWFFASDAELYAEHATQAAMGGVPGILNVSSAVPSPTYVQAIALSSVLFGNVISAALLFNLLCFLATAAILVRWGATDRRLRNATFLSIVAISASPSGLLWSTQPLKDTFFQFSIVAFVAAAFLWQRAWKTDRRAAAVVAAGASMLVAHYLISGVRWYMGIILLAASFLFFLLVALLTSSRPLSALASGGLVLVLLSQLSLHASAPYLPPSLSDLLALRGTGISKVPSELAIRMDRFRGGFERSGGNTAIRPGPQLVTAEPPDSVEPPSHRSVEAQRGMKAPPTNAPSLPPPEEVIPPEPKAKPGRPAPVEPDRTSTSEESTEVARNASEPVRTPSVASEGTSSATGAAPAPEPKRALPATPKVAVVTPRPPTQPTTTGSVVGHADRTEQTGRPVEIVAAEDASPTQPVQSVTTSASSSGPPGEPAKPPARKEAKHETPATSPQPAPARPPSPAPVKEQDVRREGAPPAVVVPRTSQPVPLQTPRPGKEEASELSPALTPPLDAIPVIESRAARLALGAVALVLPRMVATRLGLLDIGGGGGMWWLVELDTLLFDLILLAALLAIVSSTRLRRYRNPTFWLLLCAAIMVGVALAYTVTNFGTLFRLRVMLFTVVALIPLVLTTVLEPAPAPAESRDSPPAGQPELTP